MGQDVVFGAGQYAPGASEGRRLMAHELTHVVQQIGYPEKGRDIQTKPAAKHRFELVVLKNIPFDRREIVFEVDILRRFNNNVADFRIPEPWWPDLIWKSNYQRDVYRKLMHMKPAPKTASITVDFRKGATLEESFLWFYVMGTSLVVPPVDSMEPVDEPKSEESALAKPEGYKAGEMFNPVYEESTGEEVLHTVHNVTEVVHLGVEATELVATLTGSMHFLEAFRAVMAINCITAATGILNIVLFVIEFEKAMKTGIRLAQAQATSYAIVAIANGLEPPEPWGLAPRGREVWIKTMREIKGSFEAIINMSGKGSRFGDMMAGAMLGYLTAIRKEGREVAVNAIFQKMVQNEAHFIRRVTLPWPHSSKPPNKLDWSVPLPTDR